MKVKNELDALLEKGWDVVDACRILKDVYCDLLVIRATVLGIDDEEIQNYIRTIKFINCVKEKKTLGGQYE